MKPEVQRLSGPLDTHDASDGSGLKILDNWLGYRVGNKTYWVEPGFRTDFASMPWYTSWLVRWNKVDDASVIHDKPFADGFIYVTDDENGEIREPTLREMNRVWRVIAQYGTTTRPRSLRMKLLGLHEDRAAWWQAWTAWGGLAIGSWIPWSKRPRA